MAEPTQALRGRPALVARDIGGNLRLAPDALALQLLPPRARFSLRIDPAQLPADGQAAGFMLEMPINRCLKAGAGTAMRLGPDEWLLHGAEDAAARIVRDLEAALEGRRYSLVDVSHRQVAFALSGAHATEVLNSGCLLDLSLAAFPTGAATRTLLGKCEVILARTGDEPTFEIECGRSFAAYVAAFLSEAARELV